MSTIPYQVMTTKMIQTSAADRTASRASTIKPDARLSRISNRWRWTRSAITPPTGPNNDGR